ncbi:MAG: SPOR domain-containing protein [Ignavibacteria bacterium]|jgi:cell division septation protein DedD
MANNDPNWSDDGFDSLNDGFLPRKPVQAEPVSSYQAPVPPPPTPPSRRNDAPKRAVLFLLLFFITVVGLLITWVAKGPDSGTGDPAEQVVVKPSIEPDPVENKTDTAAQSGAAQRNESLDTARRQTSDVASVSPKTKAQKPATDSVVVDDVAVAKEPKRQPELADKVDVKPKPEKSQQPSTRSSANALQEWCVQVFASTNADDADEWNDRLRTKNVYDSRIEIVDRQGQTWYRVRFGRFASRQEAEQSALGMGFRNAWVNRTR